MMIRIGAINLGKNNLSTFQGFAVSAIEWRIKKLFTSHGLKPDKLSKMVAVGNPTMLHIILGVNPEPFGSSPYKPAFYDAKTIRADDFVFKFSSFPIQTMPPISGFLGERYP